MKTETVTACRRNLWSENVDNFNGFPAPDNEVTCIVQVPRNAECDGFDDVPQEDAEELRAIEEH